MVYVKTFWDTDSTEGTEKFRKLTEKTVLSASSVSEKRNYQPRCLRLRKRNRVAIDRRIAPTPMNMPYESGSHEKAENRRSSRTMYRAVNTMKSRRRTIAING
jgi:hypothetical protein